MSTIQVQIKGTGPFTFVFDTGAGVNVINQDLATRLELPVIGTLEIVSPMGDGPTASNTLAIAELTIGDVTINDATSIAMNLTELFLPLEAPDGILAAAAIEGHVMTINLPAGYVLLRKGALPAADGRSVLDYDGEGVVPMIPILIGGETVKVALDSGAPAGLTLPSSYIDRLALEAAPVVTGRGRTVDAGFEIRSSRLLGEVRFGEVSVKDPMIAFNDKSPHGNVGSRILGNYSISIDRSPQRMVRQGGGKQSYGIQLRGLGGDVISVAGTVAGLPAATAGLMAGDKIVALNGTPLSSLTADERIKNLRGSPLVLLLDRDGEEMELTLVLGQ